jgi:hypothetical protein
MTKKTHMNNTLLFHVPLGDGWIFLFVPIAIVVGLGVLLFKAGQWYQKGKTK